MLVVLILTAFVVLSVAGKDIAVENMCIERRVTMENVHMLQGRIDNGERLWQRQKRNLITAREGLHKHAQGLADGIALNGYDHDLVCGPDAQPPLSTAATEATQKLKEKSTLMDV